MNISINFRLISIMCIVMSTLFGVVASTLWVLRYQKADAVIINLAGRQRMLTQKYHKEVLEEFNIRQVAVSVVV